MFIDINPTTKQPQIALPIRVEQRIDSYYETLADDSPYHRDNIIEAKQVTGIFKVNEDNSIHKLWPAISLEMYWNFSPTLEYPGLTKNFSFSYTYIAPMKMWIAADISSRTFKKSTDFKNWENLTTSTVDIWPALSVWNNLYYLKSIKYYEDCDTLLIRGISKNTQFSNRRWDEFWPNFVSNLKVGKAPNADDPTSGIRELVSLSLITYISQKQQWIIDRYEEGEIYIYDKAFNTYTIHSKPFSTSNCPNLLNYKDTLYELGQTSSTEGLSLYTSKNGIDWTKHTAFFYINNVPVKPTHFWADVESFIMKDGSFGMLCPWAEFEDIGETGFFAKSTDKGITWNIVNTPLKSDIRYWEDDTFTSDGYPKKVTFCVSNDFCKTWKDIKYTTPLDESKCSNATPVIKKLSDTEYIIQCRTSRPCPLEYRNRAIKVKL